MAPVPDISGPGPFSSGRRKTEEFTITKKENF
jgi:hypothetical protein